MPIRERTSHEIPGKVPASAAGLFRNHGTGASDNPPFVGETNTRYGKVLKYAVGNENKQRGVGGKVTLTR